MTRNKLPVSISRCFAGLSCAIAALLLSGCASIPEYQYQYFTQEYAANWITQQAGQAAPPGVVLASAYLENWQKRHVDDWAGTTFTCTNSKTLNGQTSMTLTQRQGNFVQGTLLQTNECGDVTRNTFEGRYNATHLYVQFVDDRAGLTAIRRYGILNGGALVFADQNYTLLNGAWNTYHFPRSGQVTDDEIFTTTSFVASNVNTAEQLAQAQAEARRNEAANSGGGFAGFLNNAVQAATILSDTSGTAYNNYVAQSVPALAPLADVANGVNAQSGSVTASGINSGGKGAVTPGSYPARPNTLQGHPACAGYTVDNYKEYFESNSSGPDVQLHSLCAGAYNYYWMYLNAIRQGYSQADSDRTYAAFQDAANVATGFYANAR